jgi:hypothetical protein
MKNSYDLKQLVMVGLMEFFQKLRNTLLCFSFPPLCLGQNNQSRKEKNHIMAIEPENTKIIDLPGERIIEPASKHSKNSSTLHKDITINVQPTFSPHLQIQ